MTDKPPLFTYLIALGSNRPLRRGLTPDALVATALKILDQPPFHLVRAAPVIATRPMGPSRRRYANSAALIETALPPLALLDWLQATEKRFGRKRARRWGMRTLDLDIILWSEGRFSAPRLKLPHPSFRIRDFVLSPLTRIAPQWRDPVTGRTVVQLKASLNRPKPVDHPPRHL